MGPRSRLEGHLSDGHRRSAPRRSDRAYAPRTAAVHRRDQAVFSDACCQQACPGQAGGFQIVSRSKRLNRVANAALTLCATGTLTTLVIQVIQLTCEIMLLRFAHSLCEAVCQTRRRG